MDRVPFVGARVPAAWARALPLFKAVDPPLFQKLLKLADKVATHEDVTDAQLAALVSEKLGLEPLRVLFAGVHVLYVAAVRQPSLKASVLKEDLKELKLPAELIPDFAKIVDVRREQALAVALASKPAFPALAQLRWRVDVAISTSSLSRVLRPTVMLQMTLSDGHVHLFEVPLSQFHELRYNVAAVLKDMDNINQKNIFKIKD